MNDIPYDDCNDGDDIVGLVQTPTLDTNIKIEDDVPSPLVTTESRERSSEAEGEQRERTISRFSISSGV